VTLARFPDWLGGGEGGVGDDGAGSTGAALAAAVGDAGGGEASTEGSRRFAAELRREVETLARSAAAAAGRRASGLEGIEGVTRAIRSSMDG